MRDTWEITMAKWPQLALDLHDGQQIYNTCHPIVIILLYRLNLVLSFKATLLLRTRSFQPQSSRTWSSNRFQIHRTPLAANMACSLPRKYLQRLLLFITSVNTSCRHTCQVILITGLGEIHSDERVDSDYDLSLHRFQDGTSIGIDASSMGNEARPAQ